MECSQPSGSFSIFKGNEKTMPFRAVVKATGLPFDLTSCTEIVVNLVNANGSITALTLTGAAVAIVSPAILGQFTADIDEVTSAKLQVGELQNVDVTFTIDSKPQTVRFYGALSVFEIA